MIYIDGGLLEVSVNNLTVVAAAAIPSSANSTRVGVFGLGNSAVVDLITWSLKSN